MAPMTAIFASFFRAEYSLIFQQHRTSTAAAPVGQGMVGFIVAVGFSFQRFRCPEYQLQHPTGELSLTHFSGNFPAWIA